MHVAQSVVVRLSRPNTTRHSIKCVGNAVGADMAGVNSLWTVRTKHDPHSPGLALRRCRVHVSGGRGRDDMREWQPIETAKKDKRLLLWRPTHPWPWAQMVMGIWDEESYASTPRPHWNPDTRRLEGMKLARQHQPTHWMLPEPPTITPEREN